MIIGELPEAEIASFTNRVMLLLKDVGKDDFLMTNGFGVPTVTKPVAIERREYGITREYLNVS